VHANRLSCFRVVRSAFDANLDIADLVSFRKLRSSDGAIRHLGDEREGDALGDDEKIMISLDTISPKIHFLCAVITS
jgi:tellurium resistance protein TerZ